MIFTSNALLTVILATCLLGCSQQGPVKRVERQAADNRIDPAVSQEPSTKSLIDNCKRDRKKQLSLATVTAHDLQLIGELTELEVLEINKPDFECSELIAIKHLAGLKRLKLEKLAVDDAGADVIAGFSRLEVLNLPAARISDQGLHELTYKLKELLLLRIGSPQITDAGIEAIRSLPLLRFLHLINVPITDAGLKTFHDMHDLESLYIDGDSATDEGIRDLLKANPKLHFHRNQTHVADDPNTDGH